MRKKFIVAVFLLLFFSLPLPVIACTVFASSDSSVILAGNNEDWLDKDTFIWFLPNEEGSYGRVFYGFENAHPQGGMNEKGLFFDWYANGGQTAPRYDSKLDYPGDLSDALLEKCATVQEALLLYEKYNEPSFGYATILLADANGDMATITWDWVNKRPDVKLQSGGHLAIGVGQKAISPLLGQAKSVSAEAFTDLLNTASNENTLYSTVCNLKTLDITLFNQHSFADSVVLNLAAELHKGPKVMSIPSLFPDQEPGQNNQFTPWTLRTSSQNKIYISFGVLLAASVLASAALLFAAKPNILQASFIAAAGGSSAVLLWLVYFLNDRMYFAAKYGLKIYGGFASCLPWIAAVLAIAQLFTIIPVLANQKRITILRIYAIVSTIIVLAGLWYLVKLGLF